MAQFLTFPAAPSTTSQPGPTVFFFPTTSGTWIVRDAQDSKGGLFATRKAATHFIKREFGETATTINANPDATTPSIAA